MKQEFRVCKGCGLVAVTEDGSEVWNAFKCHKCEKPNWVTPEEYEKHHANIHSADRSCNGSETGVENKIRTDS